MNRAARSTTQAFTLVELIVYVAILAVVTVLAIQSTLTMTRAFADLRVSRDLNSSAAALFERITRDVRSAEGVDAAQSALGAHPGVLMLNTTDVGGTATTIEYYVESNLVKIRENGVAQGAIMGSHTTIDNFVVRQLTNATAEAVRVEATITASRGNITKTRNFYTTIVVRGSY